MNYVDKLYLHVKTFMNHDYKPKVIHKHTFNSTGNLPLVTVKTAFYTVVDRF